MQEGTQMPCVPEPRNERVGRKSNLTFWQDVKYQARHVWTNPYWYLLLVLFVYGPAINKDGWNPLDWEWGWIIYGILGPPFWLVMAVLYKRTRPY